MFLSDEKNHQSNTASTKELLSCLVTKQEQTGMNKFVLSALVAFCAAVSLQVVVSYEPLEKAAYETQQSDDYGAVKDAVDANADEGFEDDLSDYNHFEDEVDNDEDEENEEDANGWVFLLPSQTRTFFVCITASVFS